MAAVAVTPHPPYRLAPPGRAAADVLPALALTCVGLFVAAGDGSGPAWARALALPALTLPLLWRRSAPGLCCAAVAAGMVVSGLPSFDAPRCAVAVPGAMLALAGVAARRPARVSLPGLAFLLAGLWFVGATDPIVAGDRTGFLALVALLLVTTWVAGAAIGARRRLAGALAQRARELERGRERAAALAVELERERIAIEVEGAVREHLRRIVALAGRGDRSSFGRIEDGAREALNEMRQLLGALRSDVRAGVEAVPTLAALEARARTGGGEAAIEEVTMDGRVDDLPATVQVAAYRVIQHGLETIERAGASVGVRRHGTGVEVCVQGPPRADPDAAAAARAAARERVLAHGGDLLETEPRPGVRRLRAWLPTAGARD